MNENASFKKPLGQGTRWTDRQYFEEVRAVYGDEIADAKIAESWWAKLLSLKANPTSTTEPFRFTHEFILDRATTAVGKKLNHICHNRVTDFSDWIFNLYCYEDENAKILGRSVERAVADKKRKEQQRRDLARYYTKMETSAWRIDYRDPLETQAEALEISALRINDKTMWGVPDIVFRNKDTGSVLIVENKLSDRMMPSNGWPNARAQLWAYSLADRYASAPEIILLLNAYNRDGQLAGRIRWDCKDWDLRNQNVDLFQLYKRMCESDW